jgi:hypothetical protein
MAFSRQMDGRWQHAAPGWQAVYHRPFTIREGYVGQMTKLNMQYADWSGDFPYYWGIRRACMHAQLRLLSACSL